MPSRSRNRQELWQLASVQLGGVGLVCVAAVYIGFLAVESETAERLINHGGYFIMAGTFAAWLVCLWRLWPRFQGLAGDNRQAPPERRGWWWVFAVIGVLMSAVVGMESMRSKILYDEFALQSTAFNMHYFREVAAMVRGYEFMGTFTSLDNYLDKRPYFYPFLVSLVHDFTGYRPLNAYLLNLALMPIALLLVFDLGRQWHGWWGGLVAMVLLGVLPLFGQNATGSGMEMINLVMLLLAVRVGGIYLRSPDPSSLSAFCLTTVLLAQCRYESALFVACAGVVILWGWWRADRVVLSPAAALTPLLLVPVAWHNKVLSNTPVLWEMREEQTSRFGWEYVPDNAAGVIEFFLGMDRDASNSLFVSAVGALGLAMVAGLVIPRLRQPKWQDPHAIAGLVFMFGVVANLVLLLFYFWSRFTDPMASRFSLPLYAAMCLSAVGLVKRIETRWRWATPVVLVLAFLSFVGSAVPKHAHHIYSRMGIDELEWERRTVAAMPDHSRLVVTNKSTLVWLLDKTPSVLIDRAVLLEDRLIHQLNEPTFQEILVTQALRPVNAEGYHQIIPEDRLPDHFELETLVERRFGTKISRISRLTAIHSPKVFSSTEHE